MPGLLLACGVAAVLAGQTAPAPRQDRGDQLYRMTLLRAAPGRLLDLVSDVKARVASAGSDAVVLRHSQGDQWDLMLLVPLDGGDPRLLAVDRQEPFAAADLVAWQQDEFVRGPDLTKRPGFAGADLYHVEMFVALPGRRDELVREREMENAYLAALGRPTTAIFVRVLGAEWDSFTIGAYRNWKHFAERDDITPARAAEAAAKAGFKNPDQIGAYLRSLIAWHHDTLVTPVR
jgi:hypothetical protein